LKRKLVAAQRNLASSRDTFANLDETVPEDIYNTWMAQERNALVERLSNAKAMIYSKSSWKRVGPMATSTEKG